MDNGIHFYTGVPRSGHSLLAAILGQNPKIHTQAMSPVHSMIRQLMLTMGGNSEFVSMFTDEIRRNVLRSVFDGYYRDIHPIKTPLDAGGFWASHIRLIADLFPEAKVICMVRDLAWALDSTERLIQRNPLQFPRIFHENNEASTIHTRVNALLSSHGFIGYGWFSTQAEFYGEMSDRMILVDYETLCLNPLDTVNQLYQCLGMEPFQHRFDNLEWKGNKELDVRSGTPGMHDIRPKVEKWQPRRTILPPDIFRQYFGQTYWRRPYTGKAKVICAPEFLLKT